MQINSLTFAKPTTSVVGACALVLLGLTVQAQAQTTNIYNASYTSAGSTPQTGGSFNLNTFTVTAVYTAGSATTEDIFITDGSANGLIFGTQTALAGLTPGVQATASVVGSVYHNEEEFKTPTNIAIGATVAAPASAAGMLSQVAATVGTAGTANPFTVGPSDSLYASESGVLLAPVTFTITPNATGVTSTAATTVTLTDTATGDTVSTYRSNGAFAYTAGTTYTVTGLEEPFAVGGVVESEIVGISSLTPVASAVPEPSSYVLIGCAGLGLMLVVRRTRPSKVA